MSADLLRRAAAALRRDAEEAAKDFERYRAEHSPEAEFDSEVAGWLGGPIGDFAAIWTPPVALALADLVDRYAEYVETHAAWKVEPTAEFEALARAILREES